MALTMNRLSDHWWLVALRAACAFLFGLAAIMWPGLTIAILVAIFGVFVLLDGSLLVAVGVGNRDDDPRWWSLVLQGALGAIFGLVALLAPIATAMALVVLVAAWAIVSGIAEIMAAFRLRAFIENEWLLAVSGVLSILFGVILGLAPRAGIVAMAWIIGGFAILSSLLLAAMALRLRKFKSHFNSPATISHR